MSDDPTIRVPKQRRSIQKKQQIIDTAKALFAQNGYHSTTTNAIARQAKVSIGTLYAYFPDKEMILLEMLRQLSAQLYASFDFMDTPEYDALFRDDTRKWLRKMIDGLSGLQQPQRELHREIASLRYAVPGVAAVLDEQDERIRLGALALLTRHRAHVPCADIEAASIILAEFTGTLVELIVFCGCAADRQRLMDAGVEALYWAIRG